MFKKTALVLSLSLASLALTQGTALAQPAPADAPEAKPLTLGQQFIVRAYAGQLEGHVLTQVLKAKTLGVVVNNSTICVSLAGALAGEFVGHNKPEGLKHGEKSAAPRLDVVAYTPTTDISKASAGLLDKDAVALLFGGQISDADNAEAVKATLEVLAEANYPGIIFLHLTVAAKKWVEQAASEDESIRQYLDKKHNVYALAVDAKNHRGHVNQLTFTAGKAESKSVFETPLNEGFMGLFKRRLIPAQ